jgi:hypothetical protein
MTDLVVYRSAHPEVLAHWHNTIQARKDWRVKVNETIADLGFPGRRFATNGSRVIGVEHTDGDVPEGWRQDRDLRSAIVPARRTTAGRRIGDRLDALRRVEFRDNLPGGMPHLACCATDMAFMRPGVVLLGDAVYVDWSGEIEERDASHIDTDVWERIKLSEYYAAVETEGAKAS